MPKKSHVAVVISLLFSALALLPGCSSIVRQEPTESALKLEKNFSNAEETLEYHFMLNTPAMTDAKPDQVVATLTKALKPIVEVGKLSSPKAGAYIDSQDRVLNKVNLILRLRQGQLTIKARSTSLNTLIDLKPCNNQKAKYERDFFEEPGYSISSEYKFKKEEWIDDPTKATVKQTMDFMNKNCTELAKQLDPYLKPIETLTAPGTAQMYSADIKINQPLNVHFKESGFAFWTFPGTKYTLGEIAWTGYVKDKAALEVLYKETRDKLIAAGLLAQDQSSKTEQYFKAYYGPR